jgi:hypothetical protein
MITHLGELESLSDARQDTIGMRAKTMDGAPEPRMTEDAPSGADVLGFRRVEMAMPRRARPGQFGRARGVTLGEPCDARLRPGPKPG